MAEIFSISKYFGPINIINSVNISNGPELLHAAPCSGRSSADVMPVKHSRRESEAEKCLIC